MKKIIALLLALTCALALFAGLSLIHIRSYDIPWCN